MPAFVATECDADSREPELTVRAESNIALLILTFEPLSPVALVKILTVTSSADVPPNLAVALIQIG